MIRRNSMNMNSPHSKPTGIRNFFLDGRNLGLYTADIAACLGGYSMIKVKNIPVKSDQTGN